MKTDVILISYNQEVYIAKAVESVIMQKTESEVRVIVADDCSTDDTLNIIKSYEKKSKFKFVYMNHKHNLGYHENYRRAFSVCDGDYVAILEGDDWWSSENHLQQHVAFLSRHKKYSMSFNNINFYNEKTCKYAIRYWPYSKDYFEYSLKDLIVNGNQIGNLSSCVFRTRLIHKLPEEFFMLDFADWELGMWMAQFGNVVKLKESTSVYRLNDKGQWTKLDSDSKKQSIVASLNAMNSLFKFKYKRMFDKGLCNIMKGVEPKPYMTFNTKIKRLLHLKK